ncbi:MAG TPA: hypothetical protein DEP84_01040 [Chloroflexi bacterium]|nr:hypothetical protein [Chloroflexota bacterium]
MAILPTAARFSQPLLAAENGVRHFAALGATSTPLLLLDRADAARSEILDQVAAADLLYVAGGDPVYLLETLRTTPAWATIHDRLRAGTLALAGSSAGAMVLGRRMWRPRQDDLVPALDLVPVVALPHHQPGQDERVSRLRPHLEAGLCLLGLPEMAAAIWNGTAWEVAVAPLTCYTADGQVHTAAGEQLPLLPPAA